jgi:hypothetical protein
MESAIYHWRGPDREDGGSHAICYGYGGYWARTYAGVTCPACTTLLRARFAAQRRLMNIVTDKHYALGKHRVKYERRRTRRTVPPR